MNGARTAAPRHFKSKLEDAITAKQEFEARVETLEEKVKLYEQENAELKQQASEIYNLN